MKHETANPWLRGMGLLLFTAEIVVFVLPSLAVYFLFYIFMGMGGVAVLFYIPFHFLHEGMKGVDSWILASSLVVLVIAVIYLLVLFLLIRLSLAYAFCVRHSHDWYLRSLRSFVKLGGLLFLATACFIALYVFGVSSKGALQDPEPVLYFYFSGLSLWVPMLHIGISVWWVKQKA